MPDFLPYQSNSSLECLIQSDSSDGTIPISSLSYMVDTWRGHFFRHLVGFKSGGRLHYQINSTWAISKHPHRIATSLLMISPWQHSEGVVHHRDYLQLYYEITTRYPILSNIVEQFYNEDTHGFQVDCSDILFNLIVANATNRSPVILDGRQRRWSSPTLLKSKKYSLP